MICSNRLTENFTGFLNICIRVRLDLQPRQLPFGRMMRGFIGQVARSPIHFSKMLLILNFSLFMATELDFLKWTSQQAHDQRQSTLKPLWHDVMIASLLRQSDVVATSFWRNNNVIAASCVRWACKECANPLRVIQTTGQNIVFHCLNV